MCWTSWICPFWHKTAGFPTVGETLSIYSEQRRLTLPPAKMLASSSNRHENADVRMRIKIVGLFKLLVQLSWLDDKVDLT
jgi:hypothetical protein